MTTPLFAGDYWLGGSGEFHTKKCLEYCTKMVAGYAGHCWALKMLMGMQVVNTVRAEVGCDVGRRRPYFCAATV